MPLPHRSKIPFSTSLKSGAHGQPPQALRNERECQAFRENGIDCLNMTDSPHMPRCSQCHAVYKSLHGQYKSTESAYRKIQMKNLSKEDRRKKIGLGEKTLALRDEVSKRFFSDNPRNKSHVKWMLKIREEVRILKQEESEILKNEGQSSPTQENPLTDVSTKVAKVDEKKPKTVYQSLLAPNVPLDRLSHLPEDSPVRILRQSVDTMRGFFIDKLYSMVPQLNDSEIILREHHSEEHGSNKLDDSDHIMRFVFREFIVEWASIEALERAKKTESIHSFLQLSGEDLPFFIKFFDHFLDGRPDTLRFLRNAVSDFVLDPDAPSITILGGRVATEEESRKMDLRAWDILYSSFHNVVGWQIFEGYCHTFDDFVLVQQLTTLRRYGVEDEKDNYQPGWLNIEEDPVQECQLGIWLGFMEGIQGYCDPPAGLKKEAGMMVETQFRHYITGRMAKSNPLALSLIGELSKRPAGIILIVLDGPPALSSDVLVQTEINPWIMRKRTTTIGNNLENAPWEVEFPFESILTDLNILRNMKRETMSDYYQFIIIEKTPQKSNLLHQVVEDALMQLSGDPLLSQILNDGIMRIIPEDERQIYISAMSLKREGSIIPSRINTGFDPHRVRAWDVDLGFINAQFQRLALSSPVSRRRVLQILSVLETQGVVSCQTVFEPAIGMPYILTGTDGIDDVYFKHIYKKGGEEVSRSLTARGIPEVPSAQHLYQFAGEYASKNSGAIFAKGRVHVHYCAWPIPCPSKISFRTSEGHIYRWKKLPFDVPESARMWQHCLDEWMNKEFPFALFIGTTFVICASSIDDANQKLSKVLYEAKKYEWELSVPSPSYWTSDFDSLGLENLWSGVYPAAYREVNARTPKRSSGDGNVGTMQSRCIVQ